MRSARGWGVTALVTAAVFALLLIWDRLGVMDALDGRVSNWLDAHDPDRFDPVAKAISVSGQVAVVGVATAVLAVFLWRRGPRLAWLAPSAVALTGAAEIVAKLPLLHPPSPGAYLRAALDALAGQEVGLSYPSGHVARVACLALLAGAVWPRAAWRVAMAAAIAAIFAARTYAGGHTIADTLGGLTLGLSAGAAGVAWVRWRESRERPPADVSSR